MQPVVALGVLLAGIATAHAFGNAGGLFNDLEQDNHMQLSSLQPQGVRGGRSLMAGDAFPIGESDLP